VFDAQGRMLAQAVTGTPEHVNSVANAVRHFLAAYPIETMASGDHYITNDPWLTCGHLHDLPGCPFGVRAPGGNEIECVEIISPYPSAGGQSATAPRHSTTPGGRLAGATGARRERPSRRGRRAACRDVILGILLDFGSRTNLPEHQSKQTHRPGGPQGPWICPRPVTSLEINAQTNSVIAACI
jgi:hypothetical protein